MQIFYWAGRFLATLCHRKGSSLSAWVKAWLGTGAKSPRNANSVEGISNEEYTLELSVHNSRGNIIRKTSMSVTP